jgi:hypothetical protein
LSKTAVTAVVFLVTVIALSTFSVSAFAMHHEGGGANQTIGNMGESANKTGEVVQGNASDMGSKITEGANDAVGSIGEGLQDLTK